MLERRQSRVRFSVGAVECLVQTGKCLSHSTPNTGEIVIERYECQGCLFFIAYCVLFLPCRSTHTHDALDTNTIFVFRSPEQPVYRYISVVYERHQK